MKVNVEYRLGNMDDGETYERVFSDLKCSGFDVLAICVGTLWRSKSIELLELLEKDKVRFACNESFIEGSGEKLALYAPDGEEGEDHVFLERKILRSILIDWIAFIDHQKPFTKHY